MTWRLFVTCSLWAVAASLHACSEGSKEPAGEVGEVKYSSADIKLILDEDRKLRNEMQSVDGVTAARLAEFFPGLESGPRSTTAGAWVANVQIVFHHHDGRTITVNSNIERWSSAATGDRAVRGDLWGAVRPLFEPDMK